MWDAGYGTENSGCRCRIEDLGGRSRMRNGGFRVQMGMEDLGCRYWPQDADMGHRI